MADFVDECVCVCWMTSNKDESDLTKDEEEVEIEESSLLSLVCSLSYFL